jgi:hypothetical protein
MKEKHFANLSLSIKRNFSPPRTPSSIKEGKKSKWFMRFSVNTAKVIY